MQSCNIHEHQTRQKPLPLADRTQAEAGKQITILVMYKKKQKKNNYNNRTNKQSKKAPEVTAIEGLVNV